MGRIISWVKSNKLTTILIIIIFYLFWTRNPASVSPLSSNRALSELGTNMKAQSAAGIGGFSPDMMLPQEAAPAPDVKNRLVIQESYLSLLVNNVTHAQERIIQEAERLGGYMVNSNLSNPQDAPTATVTIRVPAKNLKEILATFRGLAIKVISENLTGQDVTDQFVDNEARLQTLEKTKTIFEGILEKATVIEDILNVQQQIINLQSQIDSVKGQQNYLEQSAKVAKLTIYLSTDELALPYAPSETWRPSVIFKQAVRSLIGNLRKAGTAVIWLLVYSVIIIPVLLVIYFWRKRKNI